MGPFSCHGSNNKDRFYIPLVVIAFYCDNGHNIWWQSGEFGNLEVSFYIIFVNFGVVMAWILLD